MKKIYRLFMLVIAISFAVLLTGCSKKEQFTTIKNPITDVKTINTVLQSLKDDEKTKDHIILGFYDKNTDTLHRVDLSNILLPEGDYYVVTGRPEELPSMEKKGANFSGWYTTADFKSGTKVTSVGENLQLYAKYMTFAEAGIVAVVCMAIVFGMLALIAGIISLFKFIAPKEEAKPVVKPTAPQVQAARPALKLEDIKDEDMMAAALVATIDYHEETKEDVRVVSIKQIG